MKSTIEENHMIKLYFNSFPLLGNLLGAIVGAKLIADGYPPEYAAIINTSIAGSIGGLSTQTDKDSIVNSLNKAIKNAWIEIFSSKEFQDVTEECKEELQVELLTGENAINNLITKNPYSTVSSIAHSIISKHMGRKGLGDDCWDDEKVIDAGNLIADILIQNIYNEVEINPLLSLSLKIETLQRDNNRLWNEIDNVKQQHKKSYPVESSIALTSIPYIPFLIGRKIDIDSICKSLIENNILFVHAVGGVGKTAIASAICNNYKKELTDNGSSIFYHVAWLNSTGNLKKDLLSLDIPEVSEIQPEEERVKAICIWLNNRQNATLLIIDNMDEPLKAEEKQILNYISGTTKVLITSRARTEDFVQFNLRKLSDNEAIQLFYYYYLDDYDKADVEKNSIIVAKRDDYLTVREIVEACSYNALLIELISKTASWEEEKLPLLWENLEKNIFQKESDIAPNSFHAESHGLDVELDENLTIQEQIRRLYILSKISNDRKDIMMFFSLFPPSTKVFSKVPRWAGFKKIDLKWLYDRGWVNKEGHSFLIHPMIKNSIELQFTNLKDYFNPHKYCHLITMLSDNNIFFPNEITKEEAQERIIISETISSILQYKDYISENVAALNDTIARQALNYGNYKKALHYNKVATNIYISIFGNNHLTIAIQNSNRANIYRNIGALDEAEECLAKALVILSENSNDTLVMGKVLATLGTIKGSAEKYEEAIYCSEAALTIFENIYGKYSINTANVYHDLGAYYSAIKDYQKGILYSQIELDIKNTILENDDPELANTFINIGILYTQIGVHNPPFLDKALQYFENALHILKEKLGENSPQTALCYYNKGRLLGVMNDYQNAKNCFLKALDIVKISYGEFNPKYKEIVYALQMLDKYVPH